MRVKNLSPKKKFKAQAAKAEGRIAGTMKGKKNAYTVYVHLVEARGLIKLQSNG